MTAIPKKMLRTISLVLAIALLFALTAGCGAASTTSQTTAATTTAAETTVAETTAATTVAPSEPKDPVGKYDPPIDVTFVVQSRETPLKLLGQTQEDNVWTRLLKDELGINIKYLWVAGNTEQMEQKFNLAMASGDLPDIFNVGQTDLNRLAGSDMLQDMGPSLEYLSPYGKQIFDAAGDVPFMQGTVNNKLYGIPFIGDGKEDSQFIFLRTDWLANLGLAPPKTMDDMINIIKAFTDKDPDGNGVKDTYGLGIKDELFSWGIILTGFFNSYHSYPRIWIEKDGKLEFGGVQPEAKNALAKLSELFKGGYIDPEFAVKPNDKLGEDVNTGKIGAFYSQHWYGLALGDSKKNNPKADWLPYPLVSADSGKVLNGVVNPTGSWWVANKKAKNPEAMIKILNKYYETQYDEKIQRFTTTGLVETPDGVAEAWTLCPVITYKSDLNGVYYQRLIDPLKTGDASSLWGEAKTVYGYIDKWRKTGDMSVYGWQMVYDDKSTWSIIMDDYVPNEKLIYNKFFGPTTATMVTKQGALDTMQTEVYTKIIMGQSPVDSFDQFVKDWYALGGEAITKEVNDWKSSLK